MRKFTLEIDCDNAAFGDDPVPELKRLLKLTCWSVGQLIRGDGHSIVDRAILDANGNTVGHWSFETDRPSAESTSKIDLASTLEPSFPLPVVNVVSSVSVPPQVEHERDISDEPPRSNEAKVATHGLMYSPSLWNNPSPDEDARLKASIVKDGFAPPFTGGLDEARERRAAKSLPPPDDTYTKATPDGRDYPAKRRKKVKAHPAPQPDTPSLDTSFHDHEMDVD